MAQNLSRKKLIFMTEVVRVADELQATVEECIRLERAWFANGWNSGSNAITILDIDVPVAHLTPEIITSVISACQAVLVAISSDVRNNLSKATERTT